MAEETSTAENLLEQMKAELDESLENEFRNARTDQGGMYYAASADMPCLEKTKEMRLPAAKLIRAGPLRRYRKKFKHLGWVVGEELEAEKMFMQLALTWERGEMSSSTRAFDAMDIHSKVAAVSEREGRPRVVLVKGTTGSGKTALTRELARKQPSNECFFITVDLVELAANLPVGGQYKISSIQLIAMSLCMSDHEDAFRNLPDPKLRTDAELLWASRIPITWVLDGLDKVAEEVKTSAPLRGLIAGFLANDNDLWRHRPEDLVLLTTRNGGANPFAAKVANAPLLRIDVWANSDISSYVMGYFESGRFAEVQRGVEDRLQRGGTLASFARYPILCECFCSQLADTSPVVAVTMRYEDIIGRVFEKICAVAGIRVPHGADFGFDAVAMRVAGRSSSGGSSFTLGDDAGSVTAMALIHLGILHMVADTGDAATNEFVFTDGEIDQVFVLRAGAIMVKNLQQAEADAREVIKQEWAQTLHTWFEGERTNTAADEATQRSAWQHEWEIANRKFFDGFDTWTECASHLRQKRGPRESFYSTEDDEAVNRFAASGRYSSVTAAELRQKVGDLYKTKYKRFGSVTRQMAADVPGPQGDDQRMLSDNIFTQLTLIDLNPSKTVRNQVCEADSSWVLVEKTSAPNQQQTVGAEVTKLEATSIVDSAVRCRKCREEGFVEDCESCRRLLVVEGRAGIGKSTFAMQLGRVQPSESCVFVVLPLGVLESFLPPPTLPGDAKLSMLQLLGIALSPFAQSTCNASADVYQLNSVDKATIEALWGSRHIPIVWVLDGLDEVNRRSDSRVRDFLARILSVDRDLKSSFWEQRPQDAVIVTSREEKGFYGTYLLEKPALRIDTWGEHEVKRYVGRYFGTTREGESEHGAAEKATSVLLSTALGSFARLPITCELVCFVMQQTGANDVPDVTHVYERAIDQIYLCNKGRRSQAAKGRDEDDPEFKSVEVSLARKAASQLGLDVARRFQESRKSDNADDLGLLLVEIPKRDDLSFSLVHSGWFRHVTGTRYQFVHKSFMEYFAACALATDLASLKAFAIDVGHAAQQRNLLVLLATIICREDANTPKELTGALEKGVVDSFRKHFRKAELAVELTAHTRDGVVELRDRVGSGAVSEIAKVIYQRVPYSKDLTAEQVASYSTLGTGSRAPPPFPPLGALKCSLMENIDLCAGPARRVKRLFDFFSVPTFYAWMIEPMAQQNALRPLMYVQRRICCNTAHLKELKHRRIYDAALLEASMASANDTAHFLVSHCDAQIDLKLAAEIGAASVLRRGLKAFDQQAVDLLHIALQATQLEGAGAILEVAFDSFQTSSLKTRSCMWGEIMVAIASSAQAGGIDLQSEEMLNVFGLQASKSLNIDEKRVLELSHKSETDDYGAVIVFVARSIQAKGVSLSGVTISQSQLSQLSAPSLSLRDIGDYPRALETAKTISTMRTLTALDFTNVAIFDDACLEALLPSESLRSLNVLGTKVTDAGLLRVTPLLRRLQCLTTPSSAFDGTADRRCVADRIESLDFRGARRAVIGRFGELEHFPHLRSIDLRESEMCDSELGLLAQVATLRTIDLSNTPVSDPSLLQTTNVHALAALRKLSCELESANAAPEDQRHAAANILRHITWMTGLRELNLCGIITANGLASLGSVPHVTSLEFGMLNDNSAENVGLLLGAVHVVFPGLRRLDLSGLPVSDSELPVLATCASLESLDLRGTLVRSPALFTGKNAIQQLLDPTPNGHNGPGSDEEGNHTPEDAAAQLTLHAPADRGDTQACRVILERDFEAVKEQDECGRTPLHCAAKNGHTATCRLLMSCGADALLGDECGWTPLHHAVHGDHTEACELFLDWGADINCTDIDGWSPLHLAAQRCHPETCNLLLARGADLNLGNKFDETPMDIFLENHNAVSNLLPHLDGSVAESLQGQLESFFS